jgi:hypothetical protein
MVDDGAADDAVLQSVIRASLRSMQGQEGGKAETIMVDDDEDEALRQAIALSMQGSKGGG